MPPPDIHRKYQAQIQVLTRWLSDPELRRLMSNADIFARAELDALRDLIAAHERDGASPVNTELLRIMLAMLCWPSGRAHIAAGIRRRLRRHGVKLSMADSERKLLDLRDRIAIVVSWDNRPPVLQPN